MDRILGVAVGIGILFLIIFLAPIELTSFSPAEQKTAVQKPQENSVVADPATTQGENSVVKTPTIKLDDYTDDGYSLTNMKIEFGSCLDKTESCVLLTYTFTCKNYTCKGEKFELPMRFRATQYFYDLNESDWYNGKSIYNDQSDYKLNEYRLQKVAFKLNKKGPKGLRLFLYKGIFTNSPHIIIYENPPDYASTEAGESAIKVNDYTGDGFTLTDMKLEYGICSKEEIEACVRLIYTFNCKNKACELSSSYYSRIHFSATQTSHYLNESHWFNDKYIDRSFIIKLAKDESSTRMIAFKLDRPGLKGVEITLHGYTKDENDIIYPTPPDRDKSKKSNQKKDKKKEPEIRLF